LFLDEGEESIQPETQVYIDRIEAALADDLNTAEVMAALWEVVKSDISNAQKNLIIRRFEPVLSLGLTIPEIQEEVIIPTQVSEWAKQRSEARLSNDWAESDRLRDLIKKEGFQVKDEQNGSYSLKSIDK
jgi:cysteinyl-tRNA synthetase